jgi:hypothetical protein
MGRRVLLVEPNYKNKYPPMGLMKLSTYHKKLGDDVTFYKGEFIDFVLNEIYSELIKKLSYNDASVFWEEHRDLIICYIRQGFTSALQELTTLSQDPLVKENLKVYRSYYYKKKYLQNPTWDRICITTLFTFHWKKTITTINSFKQLCKNPDQVFVGGIAASVVPQEMEAETGIAPLVGLLDQPGMLDDNDIIIDHLPLDYSILHEIDYVYPENDGYYGYTTRGCVNRCPFCAVPTLEPNFCSYISISNQINHADEHFGKKRHLLLLDNNVLASENFDEIIDEIKACGFTKNAKYVPQDEYAIAITGLISGYNDRGYIKRILQLYRLLMKKYDEEQQKEIYQILNENKLLSVHTARKDKIIELDNYFAPLFEKIHSKVQRVRYVDFNQGIDARLINEANIQKLAEIPIRPLRIAFDSWKYREIYERAIRLAAEHGIREMSNYLLYNYDEWPLELYYRLKLNIDLCEELNVNIYSFPMKYHPIKDSKYFRNRNYTGKHWNRKYVRAIQAILNSTKGKVGKGKSFFEEAFGCKEAEFEKLLYMPETMIIYRKYYKSNGMVEKWWTAFNALSSEKLNMVKSIIHNNDFNDIASLTKDPEMLAVLEYYTIQREDFENSHKKSAPGGG